MSLVRDAELVGTRFGHHDERGRLVDEGAGRHELGVREAHEGVLRVHLGDLLGAVPLAARGERVVPGHGGEACKELGAGFAVLVDRLPRGVAQGLPDERVHCDGRAHAVLLFGLGVHVLRACGPERSHARELVGRGGGVLAPLQLQTSALGRELGAQRLAAHDQRRLRLSLRDAFARAREHHQRIAALRGTHEVRGVRRAHALRDGPRRIRELAEGRCETRQRVGKQADHRDGVQPAQQCGALVLRATVRSGELDRVVHQLQRRA